MNDIEMQLKEVMADRAGSVAVAPDMGRTLRRTRVRRTANAGVGILTVVALTTISVAGVRAFTSPDASGPDLAGPGYTTGGDYGFTSIAGEYPTVASGEFRGAEWELTAMTVTERGIDTIDLQLEIRAGSRSRVEGLEVLPSDDLLMNRRVAASDVFEGADVVYGALVDSVDSAQVEVADGGETTIEPHRFSEYDSRSNMTVDFYIAFVPGDIPGFVHARDELGIDLDLEPYGEISLAPRVVASGEVPGTGAPWSLEFAALQPDRTCLVFLASGDPKNECLTRQQMEGAGPLLMVTFEAEDIKLVAAIMSDQVGNVQVEFDGRSVYLPWFQPENDDMVQWPIRMVAVGLEPGTHGSLQATNGAGEILAEERF